MERHLRRCGEARSARAAEQRGRAGAPLHRERPIEKRANHGKNTAAKRRGHMECKACGAPFLCDAVFCSKCGVRLSRAPTKTDDIAGDRLRGERGGERHSDALGAKDGFDRTKRARAGGADSRVPCAVCGRMFVRLVSS